MIYKKQLNKTIELKEDLVYLFMFTSHFLKTWCTSLKFVMKTRNILNIFHFYFQLESL